MVGKVRMALALPINHWWHVPLYVSARGLTTTAIPYHGGHFQIDLDLVDHQLLITDDGQGPFEMALEPKSIATFYSEFMAGLQSRGIDVDIWPHPVEVRDPIRFDKDKRHRMYNRRHVEAFWHALASADRVLGAFRSGFTGKASPVQFFWGSFDLASARFSGRPAPKHPGGVPNCPDWVMEEAYSGEVWSAGWWPGTDSTGPSFYAYAYPEPRRFRQSFIHPPAARFDPALGEFLLPYDAVREAANPDATVLAFLQSTYETAADLGAWDRPAIETAHVPPSSPRRPWSVRAE
jgi:hypothetical protein